MHRVSSGPRMNSSKWYYNKHITTYTTYTLLYKLEYPEFLCTVNYSANIIHTVNISLAPVHVSFILINACRKYCVGLLCPYVLTCILLFFSAKKSGSLTASILRDFQANTSFWIYVCCCEDSVGDASRSCCMASCNSRMQQKRLSYLDMIYIYIYIFVFT